MQQTTFFDVLSAILITASAAAVLGVLSYILARSARGRARAAIIMTAWFLSVVILGATGALNAQRGAGVLGLAAAILLPFGGLCFALIRYRPTRTAMLAVPIPLLISINALRVFGVTFVLLYAAQRLPAPFAPVAGWGDVFVGLTAGPIAWMIIRGGAHAKIWARTWNVIGLLDLIVAVALGATSSPGPIHIFSTPPGAQIMTTLPWIIIPCFLVPSFEALHVAIFYRLRATTEPLWSKRADPARGAASVVTS